MTVIEGIGDEVLVVLALISAFTLLFFAWSSTHVSVGRALGNVWLVQMQTFPQRRVLQVISVDQPGGAGGGVTEAGSENLAVQNQHSVTADGESHDTADSGGSRAVDASEFVGTSVEQCPSSGNNVGPDTSSRVDVDSGATLSDISSLNRDGEGDMYDLSSGDDANDSEKTMSLQVGDDASSNLQNPEKNISNEVLSTSPSDESNTELSNSAAANALIRLKFLDETLKLVRAGLDQTLGEFKRAHFSSDVSEGKVIRLIFKGQLLRDDSRSLASYGLFGDCVVHCHISNTPLSAYGDQGGASSTAAQQSLTYNYASGRSTRAEFLRASGAAGAIGGQVNGDGDGSFRAHHSHFYHHHHHNTADVGPGTSLNLGQHIYTIFGLKFAMLWSAWFVFPEYFDFTALFVLFLCSVVYGVLVYASRRQAQLAATAVAVSGGSAGSSTNPPNAASSNPEQGFSPSP